MAQIFTVEQRGIGKPDYSVSHSVYGISVGTENPLPVEVALNIKEAITVLDEGSIAATITTVLGDCEYIDLQGVPPSLTITVEATYDAASTAGIRIHVRGCYNSISCDTEDWDTWNANFTAGGTIRQTKHYDTDPRGLKVLIENLDAARPVTNVKVIATLILLKRRPPCDSYGDVDDDGWVTIKDIILIGKIILGTVIPTPEQVKRADVNGDGAVNVLDITAIELYMVRERNTFTVCGV